MVESLMVASSMEESLMEESSMEVSSMDNLCHPHLLAADLNNDYSPLHPYNVQCRS